MISQDALEQVKNRISTLSPSAGAWLFYFFFPFRKKVIKKNINIVFSNQLSTAEKKKLVALAYQHLVSYIIGTVKSILPGKQKNSKVEIKGLDDVINIMKQNPTSGIILITGHFGAFELAPAQALKQKKEFQNRICIVRKVLRNQFVQKCLFRNYEKVGFQVIPQKNSIWTIRDNLEQRKIVVLVMDQHTRKKHSVKVKFFDKLCNTYVLPAKLVQNTRALVFPVKLYYNESGQNVVEFGQQIPWVTDSSSKQELVKNTQSYNDALEQFILQHPEQWWWLHRRWKSDCVY